MGSNGSMIIVQLSLPKKKSPMITMGLALSDPMGCYRFKPRYPVVQSKIAVFFWMFIFQNISEYGISGVDKC